MQANVKVNSIFKKLMEIGKSAEGRNGKGLRHPLEGILVLLTLGYLAGIYTYRAINYFFNPLALFKEGTGKPDKAKKKAAKESMSEEEVSMWTEDIKMSKRQAKRKAKENFDLLRTIYPFRSIPHYSTMSRAIAAADSREIVVGLYELFIKMIPEDSTMRHVAIDGKALRAAINKAVENRSLYVLNVFDVAAKIFIVTYRVGEKKNEASTLMNEIKNIILGNPSIVTMDAAGTNQELIRIMVELGSEYVLPVKGNQRKLEKLLQDFFMTQTTERSEDIDAALDLGGHDEHEKPSRVIKPEVFRITKETNKKNGKYEGTDAQGTENAASAAHKAADTQDSQNTLPTAESEETAQEEAEGYVSAEGNSLEGQESEAQAEAKEEPAEESEATVNDTAAGENGVNSADSSAQADEDKDIISTEWPTTFPLFQDLFYYGEGDSPELDKNNKGLIVVKCGDLYIPMSINKNRAERVEYLVITLPKILEEDIFTKRFESVKTIILVNRYRLCKRYSPEHGKHWELTLNSVPYISCRLLTAAEAEQLISGHWTIEAAHHTLDEVMDEDLSTTRVNDAPWILSTLRKAAMNLINYAGAKRAAVTDKEMDCTGGAYEVRMNLRDNLEMGIKYITMNLGKAVDWF